MSDALLPHGKNRLVYDLGHFGLPEVPMLGVNNQTRAITGLDPHIHPGCMEICYLVKGELIFHVRERDFRMTGGSVFWTGPDETHGSGQNPFGRGQLYWLQLVLPERGKGLLGLNAKLSGPLLAGLRGMPRRLFPGNRRLKTVFEKVFRRCSAGDEPLNRLEMVAGLIEWLGLVLQSSREAGPGASSPGISEALRLIEQNHHRALSVAELAAVAHLSESRFKVRFRDEVGMPPGEYMLRERIALAGKLLRSGRGGVTRIAHELGFSSSQYFATVFRRYTNMTPREVLGRSSG